jgi:hypothetical protein
MGDASWIVTCMKDILNNNKMLSLTMIEERRFSKRIAHAGLEWVYESWGLLDVGEFGEGRVSNPGRSHNSPYSWDSHLRRQASGTALRQNCTSFLLALLN